jgi:hypothetical protein
MRIEVEGLVAMLKSEAKAAEETTAVARVG